MATTKTKGPWPRAHRRRLSAILHPRTDDPKDFHLDAAQAWAALGESGPPPDRLDAAAEYERALRCRHVSWTDRSGRCFSDESWNALVALWVDKAGLPFAIDLLLSSKPDDPNRDLFSSDDGAAWYAVRRYAFHASPEAYAAAVAHVRPAFEALSKLDRDQWKELKRRDFIAFAFARDTRWPEELLRATVESNAAIANLAVLVGACTDAALAETVLAKYGGISDTYFVFDMVEAMGRGALPLLRSVRTYRAPDRKRVAAAVAIAEAL